MKISVPVLAAACGVAAVSAGYVPSTDFPWMRDPNASPSDRAKALLANMTVQEKSHMLHGSGGGYVGNVEAIPRLNIPAIKMNDGPQGFRGDAGTSTSFPSGLTAAATFDGDLVQLWGERMGVEFFAKGANVQLGPGLCVARVPQNGRNFECASRMRDALVGLDGWGWGYKRGGGGSVLPRATPTVTAALASVSPTMCSPVPGARLSLRVALGFLVRSPTSRPPRLFVIWV
jgi:hypothetical protein